MKVICIRLNSGEEIIGQLVNNESIIVTDQFERAGPWTPEGTVTIKTVRGITFQAVGQNQMGIAFIPWSIANIDGEHKLILENCAASAYAPSNDIERGYLEQTSGIQLSAAHPPKIKM